MGIFQYKREQVVKAPLDEVWDFISSPANLKRITPKEMGFDIITGAPPEKMYAGLIIGYKVKPIAGISTSWVTEITHIEEKKYFVDEQRVGPYKIWHHEHILKPVKEGVVMTDIVSYKPPLGIIGNLANKLIIKKKLQAIFDFREKILDEIFR